MAITKMRFFTGLRCDFGGHLLAPPTLGEGCHGGLWGRSIATLAFDPRGARTRVSASKVIGLAQHWPYRCGRQLRRSQARRNRHRSNDQRGEGVDARFRNTLTIFVVARGTEQTQNFFPRISRYRGSA